MEPILIPIVALLIPIIIVPTVLGFRHARFLREVEHKERMRALELGLVPPPDDSRWPLAFVCAAIGFGVPVGLSFCLWLATRSDFPSDHYDNWEFWAFLRILCLSAPAFLCGTILAWRGFGPGRGANPSAQSLVATPKPEYDPDAYDVVGRRG